ncbi:hypothetical protein HY256_03995 [Candidatus Sumerlaeota bacterium]|nr:hypothetical protein [Candidatus Sumerlaeota bacterium]
MTFRYKAFNLSQIQTTSLRKRKCALQVEMLAELPDPTKPLADFYHAMPRVGRVTEMFAAADTMVQAALAEKDIIWLIDADFIRAGLSPLLVRLINRGFVKTVALTGAAAVCDYELAFLGLTNEDTKQGLQDGLLGMARETGEGMNEIINEGVKRGFSLGECLGRGILDRQPKFFNKSILAACVARLVTPTIHLSLGSDGFQCNPMADGMMLGKGSLKDMQILAARIEGLNEGGTLISAHQSSSLHEVFLHSFATARNLGGTINQFSLIRFGETQPDYSDVPGISSEFTIPGPIELTVPLFTGVLFSLVE